MRSDLRRKEAKIGALQQNVLSGRAGRQSILDRRRIEALENLWREVVKLNIFLWPAQMLVLLKLDEIDKRAARDPNVRQFMETISGGDHKEKMEDMRAEIERPYVPLQVWKLFSAYRSLLIFCYMRLRVSSLGMGGENMFKDEEVTKEIKGVMPHFSDYLDKYGVSGAAGLAHPLRELVFEAIRTALSSNESDVENAVASNQIVNLINELNQKMAEQTRA